MKSREIYSVAHVLLFSCNVAIAKLTYFQILKKL